MYLFYNISLKLYLFIIYLSYPFYNKAKLWVIGRKNWQNKLFKKINKNDKWIWFHCASLGEFEQGRPLIEHIKNNYPYFKIVLTFFSPSGYEIRKNYEYADLVIYLPLDSKKNAKTFIKLVKPYAVFFIKYEFWYNYINELHKSNIPTYLISAIFRPNQIFFKPYGKWYRKILEKYSVIFVQNAASEKLAITAGAKSVIKSGDTRFDRVIEIFEKRNEIEKIDSFILNSRIIVAGSTWSEDETIILNWFMSAPENIKLIIAPHNISISRIKSLCLKINAPYCLYSKLDNANAKESKILIIDNIGMLSSLYYYAEIAYIGGGFGKGIHNTLEAAVYGVPVVFGPNYKKFSEAIGLISNDAAFSVKDDEGFSRIINYLLNNEEARKVSSMQAKQYIDANKGAVSLIINNLKSSIEANY